MSEWSDDRRKLQIDFFKHLSSMATATLGFGVAYLKTALSWAVAGSLVSSVVLSASVMLVMVTKERVTPYPKWLIGIMLFAEALYLIPTVCIVYSVIAKG